MIIIRYIVHLNPYIAMSSWTSIINIVIIRTSIFQTFPKNLLTIKICKDEDPCKSLLPLQHWKVQLNECSFLSNDSEDHFGSGCWTINHHQQSFSGLTSPRWSNSIQARIDCICTQLVRYVQHCKELLDAYWFFLDITNCPSTCWTNFNITCDKEYRP